MKQDSIMCNILRNRFQYYLSGRTNRISTTLSQNLTSLSMGCRKVPWLVLHHSQYIAVKLVTLSRNSLYHTTSMPTTFNTAVSTLQIQPLSTQHCHNWHCISLKKSLQIQSINICWFPQTTARWLHRTITSQMFMKKMRSYVHRLIFVVKSVVKQLFPLSQALTFQ